MVAITNIYRQRELLEYVQNPELGVFERIETHILLPFAPFVGLVLLYKGDRLKVTEIVVDLPTRDVVLLRISIMSDRVFREGDVWLCEHGWGHKYVTIKEISGDFIYSNYSHSWEHVKYFNQRALARLGRVRKIFGFIPWGYVRD